MKTVLLLLAASAVLSACAAPWQGVAGVSPSCSEPLGGIEGNKYRAGGSAYCAQQFARDARRPSDLSRH